MDQHSRVQRLMHTRILPSWRIRIQEQPSVRQTASPICMSIAEFPYSFKTISPPTVASFRDFWAPQKTTISILPSPGLQLSCGSIFSPWKRSMFAIRRLRIVRPDLMALLASIQDYQEPSYSLSCLRISTDSPFSSTNSMLTTPVEVCSVDAPKQQKFLNLSQLQIALFTRLRSGDLQFCEQCLDSWAWQPRLKWLRKRCSKVCPHSTTSQFLPVSFSSRPFCVSERYFFESHGGGPEIHLFLAGLHPLLGELLDSPDRQAVEFLEVLVVPAWVGEDVPLKLERSALGWGLTRMRGMWGASCAASASSCSRTCSQQQQTSLALPTDSTPSYSPDPPVSNPTGPAPATPRCPSCRTAPAPAGCPRCGPRPQVSRPTAGTAPSNFPQTYLERGPAGRRLVEHQKREGFQMRKQSGNLLGAVSGGILSVGLQRAHPNKPICQLFRNCYQHPTERSEGTRRGKGYPQGLQGTLEVADVVGMEIGLGGLAEPVGLVGFGRWGDGGAVARGAVGFGVVQSVLLEFEFLQHVLQQLLAGCLLALQQEGMFLQFAFQLQEALLELRVQFFQLRCPSRHDAPEQVLALDDRVDGGGLHIPMETQNNQGSRRGFTGRGLRNRRRCLPINLQACWEQSGCRSQLGIWVHLLLCRFCLYFSVCSSTFRHCCRPNVGPVVINLPNIFPFSSAISFSRILRCSEEQVRRFWLTELLLSVSLPRGRGLLIWTIRLTMLSLLSCRNLRCRGCWGIMRRRGRVAWVSNLVRAAIRLSRCFFCASVRVWMFSLSLLPMRFHILACISISLISLQGSSSFLVSWIGTQNQSSHYAACFVQGCTEVWMAVDRPYRSLRLVIRALRRGFSSRS